MRRRARLLCARPPLSLDVSYLHAFSSAATDCLPNAANSWWKSNTAYIYELPFGRGRHFLGNTPALLQAFLGGWQLNGITTLQGGFLLLRR